MKVRTDYVTNSSSSSFIFKDLDQEKLKMLARKRMTEPCCDRWEEEYVEHLPEAIEWFIANTGEFKNAEIYDLMEVYTWYEDAILESIFGKRPSNTELKDLLKMEMSQEQKKRWNAYTVLQLYECYYETEGRWREKKTEVITEKFLMEMLESYTVTNWNDWLYEYIMEYYETLPRELEQFFGMHYGEVLACAFAAKYIFFDQMETHYIIKEIVSESGLCEYGCCHMG